MKSRRAAFLLGSLFILTGATFAARSQEFHWTGAVPPGATVEVRGVNGDIHASTGPTGTLAVAAVKTGHRDDPAEVAIQIVPHGGGITVCAVYPGGGPCLPGGGGRLGANNNDVRVDFTVTLPPGANLDAQTVNGGIQALNIVGDVRAATVNGHVDLSCDGASSASTVNGSISAEVGSSLWEGGLDFQTVNGSIRLRLPQRTSASVRASSANGRIENDFGLPVAGEWGPRSLQGDIGGGGTELRLKTVNGSIELRAL
jgi:hypothetical protein